MHIVVKNTKANRSAKFVWENRESSKAIKDNKRLKYVYRAIRENLRATWIANYNSNASQVRIRTLP